MSNARQGMEALGDFQPVGADVLDRRGADGAGDQRQVFQAGPALRQRPLHEVVPVLAGAGAHVPGVGVLADQRAAGNGHVQHQAVEVAGEHQVAAAAETKRRGRLARSTARPAQPALGFGDAHAGALRPVLDLIAADLGDGEVLRLRMREVETG
jgi:hypothetical protein